MSLPSLFGRPPETLALLQRSATSRIRGSNLKSTTTRQATPDSWSLGWSLIRFGPSWFNRCCSSFSATVTASYSTESHLRSHGIRDRRVRWTLKLRIRMGVRLGYRLCPSGPLPAANHESGYRLLWLAVRPRIDQWRSWASLVDWSLPCGWTRSPRRC